MCSVNTLKVVALSVVTHIDDPHAVTATQELS